MSRVRSAGLDVLVNNARHSGPTGGIDSIDRHAWERTVAVNLNSHYYFARRAVPLLRRSRATPSLIAMASPRGHPGDAVRVAHASTTWAIVGLVRSLAIELRPLGIRVNGILQQESNAAFRRPVDIDEGRGTGALSVLPGGPKMSPRK
jgi:NAD(P)-dependent dehydrogenase (short-subunit alcohol dehydrogenase family)